MLHEDPRIETVQGWPVTDVFTAGIAPAWHGGAGVLLRSDPLSITVLTPGDFTLRRMRQADGGGESHFG